MNKLFTKIVGAALGLTMAIGVGVAVASNREAVPVFAAIDTSTNEVAYEVTFTKGANDTGTTAPSIDSGTDYATIGTMNKAYARTKGLHLGSSKAVGSQIINLTSTGGDKGQIQATYLSVYAIQCDSGKSLKTTVTYTDSTTTTNTTATGSSLAYIDIALTSTKTISSIKFKSVTASKGRVAVDSFKVYKEKSGKTLSSIAVKTAPTKTTYYAGEYFDPTGLVIQRNFSDSTHDTYAYAGHTTDFTFSPTTSTALTESNSSVTITYGGKSTSQTITVNAARTLSSISISGYTTTFDQGDAFAFGGTVTANYEDETTADVTSLATFSGYDTSTVGSQTVTVSYGNKTTTYSITVTKVTTVTITKDDVQGKGAQGGGTSFTHTKGNVTINVSSGYGNTNYFHVYKNATMEITSSLTIAKIELTDYKSTDGGSSDGNPLSGFGSISGYSNGVWEGESTSVTFTASGAQVHMYSVKVTFASTDPLVELSTSSATSVTMMKDDSNTEVKVLVKNIDTPSWTFTFDEDEEENKTTSSYISVAPSAIDANNISTLTITTKAVGSTVLHIAVSGTTCATTIPVTVAAKPAVGTLVAKHNSTVVSSAVECITGSHVAFTFEAEDTDGNPYSVNAAALKLTITSGSSYGTAYGTTGINGVKQGTVVARFELKVLEEVFVDVTVNVVDDFIETVGTPTFVPDLEDTQEQSPTVSVFTSRPGTLHSGNSTTVPFENYKFSYSDNYASAQYGSVFTYDFSHGTTVDPTHKSQTIYVFCDIDEAAHGSYTITVEQFNDPLTAITFTNVTDNAVDVVRGNTFQLEWAYTPTNPTDGKEVEFIIDDNSDGIDITVSESGLISIGASSDLGDALVIIQSTHDDSIQDYVVVSAVLGTMKYTVNEPETLTAVSTVSAGDRVYMVATATDRSNATYEFNGYPGTYGGATSYTTNIAKLQLLEVEAGSSSGTVSFKLSGGDNDGEYISYSSSSNTLNHTSTKDATSSWTVDGSTITNANTTARQIWLNWNNGTPRFACYTDKTSTTGYYCPTFIKVTGGNSPYDVTETLFNGIHNNFGTGKTYEWSDSCPAFDEDAWLDACVALTEITNYSSYKLNRAVGNIAGNEVEQFIAKYDIIIGKFGTTHDHLDRYAQGGINYGVSPLVNIIGENTNTVAIIVIISMVSVTAIGGYFFLRKRKEN